VLRADAGQRALAGDVVALVEARNPLRGEAARDDDFRRRCDALAAWRARAPNPDPAADRAALAVVAQAGDGWRRRARAGATTAGDASSTTIGDLLIHAFPDRIARQDPDHPRRYQLSNGRGARLADDSSLVGEPWLVVIDLLHAQGDSLIRAAAPIDPARLADAFPERHATRRQIRWNRETRTVEAFEERCFAAIVLERRHVPATPADAVPALLAAVRELGLGVLPWSEAALELRQRVAFLRAHAPEIGLPDVSDARLLETLEGWLGPVLIGKRRLDAVRAEELSNALAAQLDYAQRRAIDAQAPLALRVPSGLERRVAYSADGPPVLAVKLQELFGLADTPRVANGRVPVTLHLLSPAGRPIQVTQDLHGFWERTYPEVRKELKGRYPKHPWPDDPWSAVATHRTTRGKRRE
jgi:ATP-dependent helicase HrpB